MIKPLTDKQRSFLSKVKNLTDGLEIRISPPIGHSGDISCICNRFINAGEYDTIDVADMAKLNYIREWYIKTQLK